MSQHLEYMDAKYVEVAYGPETEIAAAEDPTEDYVLSLFVDEGVIITGTRDEIAHLLLRAVEEVKKSLPKCT